MRVLTTQLRISFSIQIWIKSRLQKSHKYVNRPLEVDYLPNRRLHPVRPKKEYTGYD